MNRPVSLVRFSKFNVLQKAGTEIYAFVVKYKSFENPKKSGKVTCLLIDRGFSI